MIVFDLQSFSEQYTSKIIQAWAVGHSSGWDKNHGRLKPTVEPSRRLQDGDEIIVTGHGSQLDIPLTEIGDAPTMYYEYHWLVMNQILNVLSMIWTCIAWVCKSSIKSTCDLPFHHESSFVFISSFVNVASTVFFDPFARLSESDHGLLCRS